jgi:hypothetical protein
MANISEPTGSRACASALARQLEITSAARTRSPFVKYASWRRVKVRRATPFAGAPSLDALSPAATFHDLASAGTTAPVQSSRTSGS